MSELHFDEATHTYRYRGDVVPNVTRVLSGLTDYSQIPPDTLEVARQKGVAVHKMVELHAKGDLDEETLPEWMRPVFARWLAFLSDTGFQVLQSEQRVYSKEYRYAGTLDLFGLIRGKETLIDLKRSLMGGRVIGLQLAAYAHALAAVPVQRYALRLNEAGPYRLEPYTDPNDFRDFLTCLAHYRLKEKLA